MFLPVEHRSYNVQSKFFENVPCLVFLVEEQSEAELVSQPVRACELGENELNPKFNAG